MGTPTGRPGSVDSSGVYPVSVRATGHGISAGVGKAGACIGVFLFPVLQSSLGLRGTLLLTAGISVLGMLLTLVLPEPAGRSLDDISSEPDIIAAAEHILAAPPSRNLCQHSRTPQKWDYGSQGWGSSPWDERRFRARTVPACWADRHLDTCLERLTEIVRDHEDRIRALETPPIRSGRHAP